MGHPATYDGYNTLSYDVENRLIEAENAAWGASTYFYDPLGQRRQKVVGVNTATPVATDFVLAGSEEIADYYETSATWRLTVRGAGGLPLAAVVPAAGGGSEEIVYVHHDMKGSTVALTEPGGSGPADTYTYSDYGAPQSGSWLAYQYAGYRYDSETGLYYMPARYYSPALGRFLQADPSGFGGGFNLYAYAGNDPVNMTDSTGLSPDGSQGYTVKLSESVANPFMAAAGGPSSLTVSATCSTCFAQLKYRNVIAGRNHSFWYVGDASGNIYIIDAGPADPDCSPVHACGLLIDWPPFGPRGHYDEDNGGDAVAWTAPQSNNLCNQVSGLITSATNWNPQHTNTWYVINGSPNSNTFAHELATDVGFTNVTAPPNAPGW